jgi:hypothetical protein
MTLPAPRHPGPFRARWDKMRLETWNVLMEYGPLVVYLGFTFALGAIERRLPDGVVREGVALMKGATILVLVLPKFIRSLGEVLVTVAEVFHDVLYYARHGKRRPRGEPDHSALE